MNGKQEKRRCTKETVCFYGRSSNGTYAVLPSETLCSCIYQCDYRGEMKDFVSITFNTNY
ncbi:hypothetical protein Barb6_01971 [Bacteroidales bacterium Barb6]|nr:hypothetical protein Barb6_01971 [Bacteroidales bacterium Barb6]